MRDRLIFAVRWCLKKISRQWCLGSWKLGQNIVLAEYVNPQRPTSGDAIGIDWSLWFRIFGHYYGWGSVRTWARNDDLEIWIGQAGPYTTAESFIDLHPPLFIEREGLRFIRVRNAAPNPRDAAGSICIQATGGNFPTYIFNYLKAGESSQVSTPDAISGAVEVHRILIHLEPVGAPRIERLYGMPEWKGVTK